MRVPFLDRDLIDFATRLPVDYKQHGRVGKWIFRKSMEGILPKEIIYRPKTGFGIPLRGWMMAKDNRLEADYLSRESLTRRGLFDPDAVHKLIADNRSGYVDASYVILALACVEIWCGFSSREWLLEFAAARRSASYQLVQHSAYRRKFFHRLICLVWWNYPNAHS
ncbi:MAG: asparagine synthase [Verrucomicrobia bacterium]|nr:asparagine synthase [Verrucomicrobiota bacterium]